jgi:glutathione synthase/RimK-type ligase-like ATP-grasp enzyme
VVGAEVFASEIGSSAVDYRYPRNVDERPAINPVCLAEELAHRCRQLAASLGLVVAGIDLRRTPDGDWYCFEVNTSPGFTYYEQSTGQPIADAIARLLAAPRAVGRLK